MFPQYDYLKPNGLHGPESLTEEPMGIFGKRATTIYAIYI